MKQVKSFSFKCASCEGTHEGSPSFGYDTPYFYSCLSGEQKEAWEKLSDNLCIVENDEEEDYFIRVVLIVPVEGVEEGFTWGVWISVSESNFQKYVENFSSDSYADHYFGWFSNLLPYYPNTLSIKTDLRGIVWVSSELNRV